MEIEYEAAKDEDAKLLASMYGVGPFTGLLLSAEIDTITRFSNPKKLVSMAGLCPSIVQSGDKMFMTYKETRHEQTDLLGIVRGCKYCRKI